MFAKRKLARQFGEALRLIEIDKDVLEWVLTVLKESHGDEKRNHNEMIAKLQREYQKLQDRSDAMYVDKLDGNVPLDFFDRKNTDWRDEQAEILRKIEQHQNANCSYLEEDVRFSNSAKAPPVFMKNKKQSKSDASSICALELPLERWRSDSSLPRTL